MGEPRVLVVEHQRSCPPALVGRWLEEAGVALDVVRPYLGEAVPDEITHDGLLVLGGSMGAQEDDRAPWLPSVRRLVREHAAADRPVLGICLGHQLAAVALGGEVTRNPLGQTVGARAGTRVLADDPLGAALPADCHVPQWNDDTVVALPPGASVVAVNDRADVLLARLAGSVWGIQGHPEATSEVVGVWARADLADGGLTGVSEDELPTLLDEVERRQPQTSAAWQPVVAAWAGLLRSR